MSSINLPKKILARQNEITQSYLAELDKHIAEILSGEATEMFEIRDFAKILHIHPRHLSNTVKFVTGKSPCSFFEEKILDIAKEKLACSKMSISQIAFDLTFDPSNFTKFFKRFEGITPKDYREKILLEKFLKK